MRLLVRAYVDDPQAREAFESSSAETYRQAGVHLMSAVGHVRTFWCDEAKSLLLDAGEMIKQIRFQTKTNRRWTLAV